MRPQPTPLSHEQLRVLYASQQGAIQARLKEFAAVPTSGYFYEMLYCLLTPQSSAVNAAKVIDQLRVLKFQEAPIDPEPILRQKECYIRFHKTKSKHLLAARDARTTILQHMSNGNSSSELREWLVKNVKGLGWKEASHVLRNIGHRNLAILDRHILKNLVRVGVLRQLPKSLTPKRYKLIENKFRKFSEQIGISMDELDLLFWSMETGEILK